MTAARDPVYSRVQLAPDTPRGCLRVAVLVSCTPHGQWIVGHTVRLDDTDGLGALRGLGQHLAGAYTDTSYKIVEIVGYLQ